MSSAASKKVSVGTQLSWVAFLSPVFSALCWFALVAMSLVGGISTGSPVGDASEGLAQTFEMGFIPSLISTMSWLFLILGIISALVTFVLQRGRSRSSLFRAVAGVILTTGIVLWLVAGRP